MPHIFYTTKIAGFHARDFRTTIYESHVMTMTNNAKKSSSSQTTLIIISNCHPIKEPL
jgi:hypothetical protein